MELSSQYVTLRRWSALFRHYLKALAMPFPLAGIIRMPVYLRDWLRYRMLAVDKPLWLDSYPALWDAGRSTPFDPHYFYQAAWLARQLADARPIGHVDIGSDIRMINVLSAFVPTEFLDYRPLPVSLRGLRCGQADLKRLSRPDASVSSLSCLHVIEHVGLGRYGDPIDPSGSRRAAAELARVLAPGGRLYISVPVGRERVCFNAHRVFAPTSVLGMFSSLQPLSFSYVDDAGAFHADVSPDDAAPCEYGCGMFVFIATP